jgi:hypothetical protein
MQTEAIGDPGPARKRQGTETLSMKYLVTMSAITFALLGGVTDIAAGSVRAPRAQSMTSPRSVGARAEATTHRVATLVSVRLAGLGSSVTSPRGPYQVRPAKIAFDLGGYYGAGTKGLWIDHLKWVDWGKPVAYASGLVHARAWPSKNFITTAGGIMLDQVRSCGAKRAYYTYASMLVPAGFPQNTQSMSYGTSEQALTAC